MPQFEALGIRVIGLSIDTKFTQKAFAEQLQLNFPLVADANRAVSPQLGTLLDEVAGIRGVNMRGVLIIDREMTVRWQFGENVTIQPDVSQVLEQVKAVLAA